MRQSQIASIGLVLGVIGLFVAVGCNGQTTPDPTSPDLAGVVLSSKHHDPGHGGGPGNGNGGGNGGGDDDGGGDPTVTITGGMVATGQPVGLKDNKKKLTLQAPNGIQVELSMMTTRDTYLQNLGACTVDQPEDFTEAKKEELLGYLVDAVQNRTWRIEVDKDSLGGSSTDNVIATTFTDDSSGALITIVVGSPELMPLSSTIVEDPTDTFTLSGGAVRVADRSGRGTKNTLKIACPNEDSITVALQR